MEYENFDLQVERGAGRGYRVSVLKAPAGEDATGAFRPPYKDDELREILERPSPSHRDLTTAGQTSSTTAEQVGGRLFAALFPERVRQRWESSRSLVETEGKGLRLRLRFKDAPFEAWPWELLFDSDRHQFLSQSTSTPIVRYLDLAQPVPRLRATPPLRMLVVIASPAGHAVLDADRECDLLQKSLQGRKTRGIVVERLDHATLEALQKRLSTPCHILHVVGHGEFDPKTQEGALILEDEAGRARSVNGRKLGAILAAQGELRLVVLNACKGARTSPSDPFAGVAQALVGCGIPAVVAMGSRITDHAAIAFTESFYGALRKNLPVDAAMADARRAMYSQRDDLEWMTPVLYTRSPDCQLFDFPPRTHWWAWGLAALALVAGGIAVPAKQLLNDRNAVYSFLNPRECPSPPGLPMAFAKINPGSFLMGERPGTEVTLTQSFCMARFEVTKRQWESIMKRSPRSSWRKTPDDELPVSNVTWFEAQDFLTRLNRLDPKAHYRFATEAQWEYAARAGTNTLFSFGDDEKDLVRYGNCKSPTESDGYEGLAPVGSFRANPWGLFDMHGNVAEWVADWAGPLPAGPVTDPTGPANGTEKIRRGGSFKLSVHCESAYRPFSKPDRHNEDTGFRIVRDPVPMK
jgi:formylglycine-generating enzyme required for sulfatase activity